MKKKTVAGFVVGLVLVAGVSAFAIASQAAASSVAGRWKIACQFDHGTMEGSVVFVEDAGKLTGTITTPHGDLPVNGEVAGTAITFSFAVDHGDGPVKVMFSGTRQDDGTLAGKASGPMGDMAWTAERAKGDEVPSAAAMFCAHLRAAHAWMAHALGIQHLHGRG